MTAPASDVPTRSYRRLDERHIVRTAETLARRISERFPGSGLSGVSSEVVGVCREAGSLARDLARPNLPLRVATGLASAVLVAAIGVAVTRLELRWSIDGISDLLQGLESGINDAVFVGVAIWFLAGWERRRKRARVLRAVHVLRALAHIIDMHQLTKDPERTLRRGSLTPTPSSPVRTMTPFELVRYLDYCSEMLALLSKTAALYLQGFEDVEALSAVEEIEDLCSGLSRKIWQKIMILDRTIESDAAAMVGS